MNSSANEGKLYRLGPRIALPAYSQPYPVPTNEPEHWRDLKVFALDPSVSKQEGAISSVRIPFEDDLGAGPSGKLFKIDMAVDGEDTAYAPLDFEEPGFLRTDGKQPDEADAAFHAQMVYAISCLTYESFRSALGRHTPWAFNGEERGHARPLTLFPFGLKDEGNAYYSREERAIRFGFIESKASSRARIPGTYLFTALSSDIIAHEVTHALLDGLRPHYSEGTNIDILAFHEAFADLIAVFQRFTFKDMVRAQMKRARGRLDRWTLLGMLAPELGMELGLQGGLRTFETSLASALEERRLDPEKPATPDSVQTLEGLSDREKNQPHKRGGVLAEAIFDAFATIVNRKTRPFIDLATDGTGVLPEGNIKTALLDEIVHVTRRVAAQFRAICIRAIDYCPPVHLTFGDYIRAIITADRTLVRDDPHGYRDAIVQACLIRGIYPDDVPTPSETSLMWNGPRREIEPIETLGLSELGFSGDPAKPKSADEIRRQGRLLGEAVMTSPALMGELGLRPPNHVYEVPEVTSIRPSRRVGPDGQVGFDLVAEMTQSCRMTVNGVTIAFRGGATVILDPLGKIRFIVRKRIDKPERQEEVARFLESEAGSHCLAPLQRESSEIFKSLCLVCPDTGGAKAEPVSTKEAVARPRDAVPRTAIRVAHPEGGLPTEVELDFGAASLFTDETRWVSIGEHHFAMTSGSKAYAAIEDCLPGYDLDDPQTIELEQE
jgi:hypothetical protein